MTVQPTRKDERESGDLQASLRAYLSEQIDFSELKTQWILTLADNPEMCSGAVRLLYQQPPNPHLTDQRALALKRIVEASFRDGPDDSTAAFEETASSEPVRPLVAKRPGQREARPQSWLTPGKVLKDRFVLEELLGQGGIGTVFRARDRLRQADGDGQGKIAIKVLRNELRNNSALRSALQREAQQAQALSHPNIARVYEIHEDDQMLFLTMELVEGELMSDVFSRLQSATLPRDRALRIITGLCRGLGHAHENGLVHADIKPGNVILASGDVPKILDFGLAQAVAPDRGAEDASLPAEASQPLRAFSAAYSSCNRLEGGTPGFSDDVYSLSCVIYELLGGHHPYDRKSSLVARELDMKPARIAGLTDLQWRTLAAGLRLSREDRTAQVYDLQEAFRTAAPMRALKIPAAESKDRGSASGSSFVRFFMAAAFVSLAVVLFFQLAPTGYVDRVYELELIQDLRSSFSKQTKEPEAAPEQSAATLTAGAGPESDAVAAVPVVPELSTDAAEASAQDIRNEDTDTGSSLPQDTAGVSPLLPDEAVSANLPGNAAVFQLDAAEYFIPESGTALAVQITRRGDVSSAASVEWTTVADSAEPDVDYVDIGGSLLQFAPGEESKTVFIPIVSDAFVERNEYFRIALRQPGEDIGPTRSYAAIVTIIDDDA